MRIPLAKLHRAFPELDRFSDADCLRYIRQATRDGRFRPSIEPIATVAWIAAVFLVIALANGILWAFRVGHEMDGQVEWIIYIVAAVGGGIMFGLLVRDRHLIGALRRAIDDARCPKCKQSLIGLPLLDSADGGERVRCPECGTVHLLADLHIRYEQLVPRETPLTPS